MLRIQRALLAELLFIALLVAVVVTAAVFLSVTLRFLSDGGGALGYSLLLDLLPKLLPLSLTHSIPFAWLAAVAMVLGRWVSDHEVVALKTAGLPPRVIIAPVLALSCLLAIGGMYYNGFHVPKSTRTLRASLRDYVPQFLSSLKGADRSITFESGRLSWDHWSTAEQKFVGVELDRRAHNGKLSEKMMMKGLGLERILEGSGKDEGLRLEIEEAYLVRVPEGDPEVAFGRGKPVTIGRVEHIGASTLFNDFFGGLHFIPRPRHMTLPELMYGVKAGGIARGTLTDLRIAIHGRLALGSAAFFFGLFALSMMLALPPSSRRVRDFMLCFAPAVVTFFPLYIAGSTFARGGVMPPWLAMWLPHMILFTASIALLVKGSRR